MKASWRDKAIILMAFAAVFLCGYGIGHLVGERRTSAASQPGLADTPAWQQETLLTLQEKLNLRPEQVTLVEKELSHTAKDIADSYHAVLLDYHRHIDRLYGRLIDVLDEKQAGRLRAEKKVLERTIELWPND